MYDPIHPDKRIRRRFARKAKSLRSIYSGAVWAMKKWYASDDNQSQKLASLLSDIKQTFGLKTRLMAPLIGRYVLRKLKKEQYPGCA